MESIIEYWASTLKAIRCYTNTSHQISKEHNIYSDLIAMKFDSFAAWALVAI